MFFTVKVWNFANQAISLSGFVNDENGTIIKSIDGFEGRVPADAQNYTLTSFSLDVYGVGNHTYKLFLDNVDGKPNGEGEEHWSEVTVEVKPMGNVVASMDCNPSLIPLDESTTCTVHLELKSADTVTLSLQEVEFGGKRVWPNGPSSVTVNKQTVTLTPTNMQEDLTITITINDELANYYFGHWGYTHKLLETPSYLVEVHLTNLSYPVSDIITLTEKKGDWKERIPGVLADFTGGAIVAVAAGSNPLSLTFVATFIAGTATTEYVVKPLGTFLWDLWGEYYWGIRDPGAGENDNNSIAGG